MTKVENKNRKPSANKEYILVAHIDPNGSAQLGMATEKEWERMILRANKNLEDIPEYLIAIQFQNNKPLKFSGRKRRHSS